VLIRVTNAGICGSDISIFNGTNSLATYPRIIGHEYGGEIIKVGDSVTEFEIGDTVAVDPVRSCGHCYACKIGRHNVCRSVEVTGVHRDGGFSEFVVAPEENVYKLDTSKVSKDLVGLVEPYSIGVQCNTRAQVSLGDTMLVMGSGPIGISVMQVAKSRGAKVMMTDIIDSRLKRATDMGADCIVNVKNQNLEKAVEDFTNFEGMSVVVDTVCSVDSFPQALDLASPAGRVVTLGLGTKPSMIPEVALTKKELSVLGSRLNNNCFAEVIKGFESGLLTPQKLRTHTFHFTEINKALDLIRNHPEEVCKVALRFD
jgi:L-gulonate 5-dehydrogenase